jgi:hypothetical protein
VEFPSSDSSDENRSNYSQRSVLSDRLRDDYPYLFSKSLYPVSLLTTDYNYDDVYNTARSNAGLDRSSTQYLS